MPVNPTHSIDKSVLILGGAGLVGAQIAHQVARDLRPEKIVIASLYQKEVRDVAHELKKEFAGINFVEMWGNLFVRADFDREDRSDLMASPSRRRALYEDLFGPLDDAYEKSVLARAVREHSPDIIIDCVNTASGISYQDVYTNSIEVRKGLDFIEGCIADHDLKQIWDRRKQIERTLETLLVSQSIPQLIRHTQLLYRAMVEVGTRVYIKVGTTGTGGMGLNVPYTHGEDKPSAKLMSKTAVAFAHTGLMFLMARTPGGPIVKEIKPGAMIGYKKVTFQSLKSRRDNSPMLIYAPQSQQLDGGELELSLPRDDFKKLGELQMVGVDTGENGFFARGEFEAVTSINQMEFVTPEEIASNVVLEIKGSNTGVDVIAAVDSAIMVPSYRAGYLRGSAIEAMRRLERETSSHSIATGELGPPKLTKLLYEAHLLKTKYRTLQSVVDLGPEEISQSLWRYIQRNHDLRNTIISIGIPILPPDASRLVRGPRINVPEYAGRSSLPVSRQAIDEWAERGWIDLRPDNILRWQDRFRRMLRSAQRIHRQGSAAITMSAYRSEEIRIGEVVGWIFNNEEEGYRIK
jgi:NAD(P)-dependent dehydrogenase (short-subunit alcohol dehydrogenase family)